MFPRQYNFITAKIQYFNIVTILNVNNTTYECKGIKSVTNFAYKCLCNSAGTEHEPPEDDAVASKHVGTL
jgi:hypothetical protein